MSELAKTRRLGIRRGAARSKKKCRHTCRRPNEGYFVRRLHATRLGAFAAVLESFRLSSLDQVDNLKT
jgi:hypothetical protein